MVKWYVIVAWFNKYAFFIIGWHKEKLLILLQPSGPDIKYTLAIVEHVNQQHLYLSETRHY